MQSTPLNNRNVELSKQCKFVVFSVQHGTEIHNPYLTPLVMAVLPDALERNTIQGNIDPLQPTTETMICVEFKSWAAMADA